MSEFNPYIVGIFLIIVGCITCFHGFRIKKILFTIIWFLIGFSISKGLFGNSFEEIAMLHSLSTIIGLLCALFSYKIELFNVFLATSWMVGSTIYSRLNFDGAGNFVIAVIVGFIIGSLAIKFVKPLLIVSTSIAGARIIVDGITNLQLIIEPLALLGIEIVMIILGIVYQFKTQKHST